MNLALKDVEQISSYCLRKIQTLNNTSINIHTDFYCAISRSNAYD